MERALLLTRGIVVFPGAKTEIEVGRTKSVNSIKLALKDKKIIICSQISPDIEDPKKEQIFEVGTLCSIVSSKELEDGDINVVVKGVKRVKVNDLIEHNHTLTCDYTELKETNITSKENTQKIKDIYSLVKESVTEMSKEEQDGLKGLFLGTPSASKITDYVAASITTIDLKTKQSILEETDVTKRLEKVASIMISPMDKQKIDNDISKKINETLSKQQKEFYLREKMKAVKSELGQISPKDNDVAALRKRAEEEPYPKEIKARVLEEIEKMEGAHPQEAAVSRSHIEWLLDLPYWQESKDNNSIVNVEKVLNDSHFGLDKVKERIVEYLAVRSRNPKAKSPIMCLVGPPGVGKSSLAKSIAEALNKEFVKISLGGVHDESELRGHRKTYVGAMPGRIIKGMKKAGVINPLILLDEIDKMASDQKGDPASAMLEILDPEQNAMFNDNYIEENYDLSNVLFVCTANYPNNIPYALYDRLEIIDISSYTEIEKLNIAKKHIIPRVLKNSSILEGEMTFEDDAILSIIQHYSREAGVRELDRLIQKIVRKYIVQEQRGTVKNVVITPANVKDYLGKIIYDHTIKDKFPVPGVVNGMAVTSVGGELLPIEVSVMKGKGKIVITGNLEKTMNESAQVALGYVRAHSKEFGINEINWDKTDIHIHAPAGGIPKDGPSAGVTLTTAIISALTNKVIPNNIAMTGEITLRGKVGIIGGVKEKSMGAFRAGVTEIFIPKDDERYLEEIPKEIYENIEFHLIDNYSEIFESIFNR